MYYYTSMDYSIKVGEYHASEENKEWYNQRNEELLKDKLSGMSNAQLVTKYQISTARIQQLLKNERTKHELRNIK